MDLSSLKTAPPRDDRLQLLDGRVHEVAGRGSVAFALAHAAQVGGKVAWIRPSWQPERLMAQGVGDWRPQLLIVDVRNEMDLLWAIEETLRSSVIRLVVAPPKKALTLTQGRRFQLAATQGQTTGIMMISEGNDCPVAETRWHCRPEPAPHTNCVLHRWQLVKDKKGPPAEWLVELDLITGKRLAKHITATHALSA